MSDDVRKSLDKIIDDVDIIGILFKNAFTALYFYEHSRRQLDKKSISKKVQSALFAERSEELYQSGIGPTKFVLQLPDWTNPNDAEVNAVISLCNSIQELELLGVIQTIETQAENINGKKTKKDAD